MSHVPEPGDDATPHSSAVPVPKVVAATAAAAAATIIMVIIGLVTNSDIPVGLEGAVATLIAFVVGYLTPPAGA